MKKGKYRSKAGSTLKISGKYGGIFSLDYDRMEESACPDCIFSPVPEEEYSCIMRVSWYCEKCGGGSAKFYKEKEQPWE